SSGLTPRSGLRAPEISRVVRVTTNQTAGTAAKTSSAVLKLEATGMERLRPVASATYAARQAGHFGSKAMSAPGKIRLAHPNRGARKENPECVFLGFVRRLRRAAFVSLEGDP